jgi:hypothetical protein
MDNVPRFRPGVGAAALVTLLACARSDLLGPGAPQGIEGTVLLGPQCPVETLEDPCPDLPYQAWIAVRRIDGPTVGRTRSGTDGRFRMGLRAGSYVLHPESGDPFPVATEMDVEVSEGVYTEVTVRFDTGIR